MIPHEGCGTCFHSVRAHAEGGGRCENEGCACRGFLARSVVPEPAALTPREHDEVESLAREIFVRDAAAGSDLLLATEFAWKAAEAFVRSKAARPPRPKLSRSGLGEGR